LLLLAVIAGSLLINGVLKQPIDLVAAHLPRFDTDSGDLAVNSASSAAVLCVGAWLAGRLGVRAFARGSRRTIHSVGGWWAIAGTLVLGYLTLFVMTAQQSWLAVVVELAVLPTFAAGVLVRSDVAFGGIARRLLVVFLVVGLVMPVLLLSALTTSVSSGDSYSFDMTGELAAFDRVAPSWTADPAAQLVTPADTALGPSSIDQTFDVVDPAALGRFADVRFELWRAVQDGAAPAGFDGAMLPDPAFAGPYASQKIDVSQGSVAARFDLGHVRASRWLLFLTGVGPDGHRYRLDNFPQSYVTSFNGTVWNWLTAAN
jgi:hypothetical protein